MLNKNYKIVNIKLDSCLFNGKKLHLVLFKNTVVFRSYDFEVVYSFYKDFKNLYKNYKILD